MLGTTLRFDHEVRDEKEFFKGIGAHRVPKEMVSLASHILDTKAGHFDPEKFKDAGHIVITLDVGGPKVDLALEPDVALRLVDACAKGYADSRDIKKVPKESRTLFTVSAFDMGRNDQSGVMGLTVAFGGGGHLSFALDDAMANSLFEMLGVLTGRITPKAEKTSH